MKNYDIWGSKPTRKQPSEETNSYIIENTSNLTSSRDGRGKKIMNLISKYKFDWKRKWY